MTKFYTAPTALRALMVSGESHVNKCDLSSLKVLGSVGEILNPEVGHYTLHRTPRAMQVSSIMLWCG